MQEHITVDSLFTASALQIQQCWLSLTAKECKQSDSVHTYTQIISPCQHFWTNMVNTLGAALRFGEITESDYLGKKSPDPFISEWVITSVFPALAVWLSTPDLPPPIPPNRSNMAFALAEYASSTVFPPRRHDHRLFTKTHPASLETTLASIILPQIGCLTSLCHFVSLTAPWKNSASSQPPLFFFLLQGWIRRNYHAKGKICLSVSALPLCFGLNFLCWLSSRKRLGNLVRPPLLSLSSSFWFVCFCLLRTCNLVLLLKVLFMLRSHHFWHLHLKL